MTVTKDDFEKIWASSSPLTPYSFTDSNYKEGWNFVGATPPSRQMWDAFMQNADEKLKYLYQHEDVPLGHEYFTFNPNIPQGSLPLFGGEYSRETYADLWAWVQQQTGYLKTEAEWQTLATANNGNVPYYSDGDGSTTFRVPSLKCWVKGANGTVIEVGSYLEAGLPNITGGFDVRGATNTAVILNGNGACSIQNPSSASIQSINIGTSVVTPSYGKGLSVDASLSSPIYGNANTVVPESIIGMWLVKAYGVIVDTGQIDEQQYIDDRFAILNATFLDKILTNLQKTEDLPVGTSFPAVSILSKMISNMNTEDGVMYDFSNANAWYICLGAKFGGLIVQGGSVNTVNGKTNDNEGQLPIPFSNSNYKILAINGADSSSGICCVGKPKDTSTFYFGLYVPVNNSWAGGSAFNWVAIGW